MINGRAVARLAASDVDALAEILHNLVAEVAMLRARVEALEEDRRDAAAAAAEIDAATRAAMTMPGIL